MYSIIPLQYSDYDEFLIGWWDEWGWVPPTRDFLPDDGKGGILVSYDGIPVCAGFLYTTNSKVAWVDWIISDRSFRKEEERKECIRLLVSTLTNIAKKTGHKFAYALIKHKGLIEAYESLGYISGDNYTSEMIKSL
jgi:hypothetical protein